MSYWRRKAQPIIAKVLAETEGKPEAEIKEALLDAYPFGPRQHHPYKIWLSEIAIQCGRKPPLGTRKAQPAKANPATPDPRQGSMFGEQEAG